MSTCLVAPALMVVHGVRLLGYCTASNVASLYGLPTADVAQYLLDAQSRGWVRRTSFFGQVGWSLTDLGRDRDARAMAEELQRVGARSPVLLANDHFASLNERLGWVMTRWQVRPTADEPMALNDHRDAGYDDEVVGDLVRLGAQLRPVTDALTAVLPRFGVHQPRLDHALAQVRALRNEWVDSPKVASVNLVWIQFHEDLLATLGIPRGHDGP